MTRAPKNVTRAALVLALSSSTGLLVAAPAVATVGDLTGGTTTTPLPVPTVTTSPLPLPLPISTDPSPSPSPTSSPSPSPSPSTSSDPSPTPTTDPTPAPGSTSTTDPTSTTSGTTTTTSGSSTYVAPNTSTGSVSSGGTVSFAGGDTTSSSSSTQSVTDSSVRSAGLLDTVSATAGRTATSALPGAIELTLTGGEASLMGPAGAAVPQPHSRWGAVLGDLTLPPIPGGGSVASLGTSPLPGIAPLIAGAPRMPGARVNARPVLTSSRTVPSSEGDPIGLTLFACAAAAVAAGLSRRRSRNY